MASDAAREAATDDGTRVPTVAHWGSFHAVVADGRVAAVEPCREDEEPSAIAEGMASALYDRSRILQPMVRRGWLENGPGPAAGARGADPFVAVSWERALDLAAEEIDRVRRDHGNEAIYGGSSGWASAGRFHHAQSQIHRFLRTAGGYTDSIGTYSTGAMEAILPHVIGGHGWSIWERGPLWEEIAADGSLVISFGGLAAKNGEVNPGGIGRHTVGAWQQRCREAGVRFVNVSPWRDDAAAWLDAEWLALRPGTDVALMLGLAYVLVSEDLYDRDFVDRCCVGFDRFAPYLLGRSDGVPKDPAWAAEITGLDAATIADLARQIAAQRTVIQVSWSVQRQDHGEQPHWMGAVLAALSGSLGQPGGGLSAGLGMATIGLRRGGHRIAALPQGENAVETAIPVARIADMLLDPGGSYEFNGELRTYPDVRLIYWAGGNPFHHHQDLNRLVDAWQRPDTVIAHEPWWNPLARFADIVFPVATTLERNDFAVGVFDVTVSAMHRAADPPGETRTDYEVFSGIAARLGLGEAFTEGRDADEWVRELYERTRERLQGEGIDLPDFERFWQIGSIELPSPDRRPGGGFEQLRQDPDRNPLDTPSGRLEIFSDTIAGFGYDDCPGHPTWLEPREWLGASTTSRFPLHLISTQPRTRLHSQYDNGSHSRGGKVSGREPLVMHPEDAAARGIADGDVVRVHNDRGACLAGVKLDDGVLRGVVVLATGAWYDPAEAGRPGSLDRHGNPNVLTADRGTSRLAQASSAGSALVDVVRVEEPAPAVLAFEPPAILHEYDLVSPARRGG